MTARTSRRSRGLGRGGAELLLHLGVERVHRRPVEPDRADAAVDLERQEVSHLREPSRGCARIPLVPSSGATAYAGGHRPRRDLPPPLGATPRRDGVGRRGLRRPRRRRRALPVRRGRPPRPRRVAAVGSTERAHGTWFGYVSRRRRGPALRLPGRTARGTRRARAAAQPGQAAARPVRPGDRGRRDVATRGLRPLGRTTSCAATPTSATTATRAPFVPRCVVVADDFDWGDDVAPAGAVAETRDLRGARAQGLTRLHPASRGAARARTPGSRTRPRSST